MAGKRRKRLLKLRHTTPFSFTGAPRGFATYGARWGGIPYVAWCARPSKVGTMAHDFDSPDGDLATFVLSGVLLTSASYERRRVAVAIDPVRVIANSDMIAKVRMKIIMIAPIPWIRTRGTKGRALFSIN